ncbi:hypothetical protein Tco_0932427 [Tanacetum coccineum]
MKYLRPLVIIDGAHLKDDVDHGAESVNSLSRRARKLPATRLMGFFRALLQRWYYERRYEGDVDEHELKPWEIAKVDQVVAKEINYIVNEARGAKDTLGILFWGVMHKRFGVITSWDICYDLKSLLFKYSVMSSDSASSEEPDSPKTTSASPDYVPGLEEPEQAPLSPDYVPGPEYPEYLAPSDEEVLVEDQPYATVDSPIALSPGYVAKSDPEEDYEDGPPVLVDEDEDPEEEEFKEEEEPQKEEDMDRDDE